MRKKKNDPDVFPFKQGEVENSEDKLFLKKVIALIEHNIGDENLNFKSLSIDLCKSKSVLYKKISVLTGKSIRELIYAVRLQNAAKLIITREYTISEIAFIVGFKNISHFSTLFKKHFNVTPTIFFEKFEVKNKKSYSL